MRGDYWSRLVLCPLDVRVLRATDPSWRRTAGEVGQVVGCAEDVANSALRRLEAHMLVDPDRYRPRGWVRTQWGDVTLEHQP
jgi:hypothetical protein